MSIEQIEEAIQKLPASEREALESRLLARRFGLDALNEAERAELVASLDDAERDIDEGRTYNGDQRSSPVSARLTPIWRKPARPAIHHKRLMMRGNPVAISFSKFADC